MTHLKSKNVKNKKFYREANEMEPGWGDFLKSVDLLKDEVDNNQPITFNDALYIAWSEYRIQSGDFKHIKQIMFKNKINQKKMRNELWQSLIQAAKVMDKPIESNSKIDL